MGKPIHEQVMTSLRQSEKLTGRLKTNLFSVLSSKAYSNYVTMSDSDDQSPSPGEDGHAEDLGMCGFGREPRFTAEELAAGAGEDRAVNEDEAMAIAQDVVWPPESRLQNLEWCECSECTIQETRLDCICCRDAALTLDMTQGNGVACVTKISDFDILILHRGVLTLALRGYFEMRKQPMAVGEVPDNK